MKKKVNNKQINDFIKKMDKNPSLGNTRNCVDGKCQSIANKR